VVVLLGLQKVAISGSEEQLGSFRQVLEQEDEDTDGMTPRSWRDSQTV
jgi:hypothetical protein